MNDQKARVFISCGQHYKHEREAVERIKELFVSRDFEEPYIAVLDQQLGGVLENIYAKLRYSEYFLFIDFKRERLNWWRKESRGSLFSHQELALAKYLELPVMAFKQRGVRREGMEAFMQLNSEPFGTVEELLSLIKERLDKKVWLSSHRNELHLRLYSSEPEAIPFYDVKPLAYWYRIAVLNLNKNVDALNCRASVSIVTPNVEIYQIQHSLKWSGQTTIDTRIPKDEGVLMDAIFIFDDNPAQSFIYAIDDSIPRRTSIINGPGEFVLEFTVKSSNFAPVQAMFRLHLGTNRDDFKLVSINQ